MYVASHMDLHMGHSPRFQRYISHHGSYSVRLDASLSRALGILLVEIELWNFDRYESKTVYFFYEYVYL